MTHASRPTANDPSADALRLGPFELVEKLARGGSGEVWHARHATQGVDVALKLLTAATGQDSRHARAFEREIEAVARLDHPGIVRLLDYGFVDAADEAASEARLEEGTPYLVMELADHALGQARTPLAWPQLRTLLFALLDALDHAHARSVIHRDLKPGNVLFERSDDGEHLTVKLADFGIAHALVRTISETRPGAFSGTPAYIAPEQLLGTRRDLGPWTDLYSLGVMAYELASGELPFEARNVIGLIQAHVSAEPKRLVPAASDVPSGFVDWVHTLLEKAPADRYQHTAEAAWALRRMTRHDGLDELVELDARLFESESVDALADTEGRDTVRETIPGGDIARALLDSTVSSVLQHILPEDEATPERIPMPESWRQKHASAGPPPLLLGSGLNLLARRVPTIVGRERERDVLWQALRDVHEHDAPRALIVEAPTGTGKTRLVQWLAVRGYEVGACFPLRANLRAVPRPGGGLARGISRFLRVRGEAPKVARERIRAFLRTTNNALEPLSPNARRKAVPLPPRAERQVDAIMALVQPTLRQSPGTTGGTNRSSVLSARERRRRHRDERQLGIVDERSDDGRVALRTMVSQLSTQRPVLLWLDDAHYAAQTLEWAVSLFDADEPTLPVLVVCTVDPDALDVRPDAARHISTLAGTEGGRRLALRPLSADNQIRLLEERLGIEAPLAHDVFRRAQSLTGALELVREWVERDLLEPGPSGFRLRDETDDPLPRDVSRIWSRKALGHHSVSAERDDVPLATSTYDPDTLGLGLAVAAVLDPHTRRPSWLALAESAGVDAPEGVLGELTRRGLLHERQHDAAVDEFDTTIAFGHPRVRERAEAAAREDGQWTRLHRLAAQTLMRRESSVVGVHARLARHWREAGEFGRAIDALLEAALDDLILHDDEEAFEHLVAREALLSQQDAPPDDPRWGHGWLVRARLRLRTGERALAERDVQQASALADAHGHADLAAESCWVRGYLALFDGDHDYGEAAFNDALERFQELRDGPGVARSHAGLGELFRAQGAIGAAMAEHRQATHLYRALGDRAGVGRSLTVLAELHRMLGEDDDAMTLLQDAQPHLRAAGDAIALAHNVNLCGEVARAQNDLESALTCHTEALRRLTAADDREAVAAELNLALVLLALERIDDARNHLLAACAACERHGRVDALGLVHVLLTACAAHDREWSDYDAHLALANHWLAECGVRDVDVATWAERAAEWASEAGQNDRGRHAAEIASSQWGQLDRSADLVRSMRLLERL